MLPKANRLPSSQIRSLLRHGNRVSNQYMEVLIVSNQAQQARFAFVVSASIDKRATKRNRIKRLMRESVHKILNQITNGHDVVMIARSKQLLGKEEEIPTSVHALFREAALL